MSRTLLLLVLVAAASARALPVLDIGPADREIQLAPAAEYLLDATSTLGPDAVRSEAAGWRPVGAEHLNLGFTDATCWIRWSMRVVSGSGHDFILEIDSPLLDELDLYVSRDGAVIDAMSTGDRRPYADRPYDIHTFAFPVRLDADVPYEFLLRVHTTSSLQVPLILWEPHAYSQAGMRTYGFLGAFYGIIGVIIAYNLILWLSMRERNNLYFVVYSSTFLVLMAAIQGIAYRFLWPASPWLQQHGVALLLPLTTGLSLLFFDNFLGSCVGCPRRGRLFTVGAGVCAALALVAVAVPYQLVVRPFMALALVVVCANLAAAIRVWRGGSRPAMWLVWAQGAFVLGVATLIISKIGLLPRTLLTESSPALGMVAQSALMTMGLVARIQDDKRARREAQLNVVEAQRESNRRLQVAVQQRTSELQDVMRQLAQANVDLDMNNRLDGLTGIFNRRAFDERLALEFAHAQRDGDPLAVVMLDIDRFKDFNDNYGHLVGDDCLRAVAQTINETAQRTTDFAARFGGEEFAVIIPDAAPGQAQAFGELVRAAVESMTFEVEGRRVPVTVSVGVGVLVPGHETETDAVIALADAALYRAKANGRNRVESG